MLSNLDGCRLTCMDVVELVWMLSNLYGCRPTHMAVVELVGVVGPWNSRHGGGGADGECCGGLVIVSGKLRRDR
jgi:hypothetical protein